MSPRLGALRACKQACKPPCSTRNLFWTCRRTIYASSNGLRRPLITPSRLPLTRSVHSTPGSTPESTAESTPEPSPEHPPKPPLSESVRLAMRAVPHPLVLITCSSPTGPAGMLVSSFNTITLKPTPFVSFNIKLPSRTHSAISISRKFSIHALSVSGIWLANAFLGWKKKKGEQWPDVPGKESLEEQTGVQFTLRCEWVQEKSVEVADHIVVVGKVVDVVVGREKVVKEKVVKEKVVKNGKVPGKGKGLGGVLIYCEGRYRRVGEGVDTRGPRHK